MLCIKDLVALVAEETEFTKKDVREIIQSFLENLRGSLMVEGHKTRLHDFGTFKVVIRKGRKYSSPVGGTVTKPDSRVVKFKPAALLKSVVNS